MKSLYPLKERTGIVRPLPGSRSWELSEEQAAQLSSAGGAWLIVRGAPHYANTLGGYLKSWLKQRGINVTVVAEPFGNATPGSALELILWDMAQAEHLEESSALATRIQDELGAVTGSQVRGVKQAPFRVLVGATMPAVLVEVAFISNPREEKLLNSEAYQDKVAGALLRGIARYRREHAVRHGVSTSSAGRP